MGVFEPIASTEYQALCGKALRKVSSMAAIAATCEPGATALVEESLLGALRMLAAWGEQHG